MSQETTGTQERQAEYRALIARIDDTMAALTRERRRLEERAAETSEPAATREMRRER